MFLISTTAGKRLARKGAEKEKEIYTRFSPKILQEKLFSEF
jgi:hypothetical protein